MIGRRAAAFLVAVCVLAAGAAAARGRLVDLEPERRSSAELLYLPNGEHLRAWSLGHASTVASLTYLWAIQFYSDYDRADRFRYVEHVFGDVISRLDPRYVDPYWLGALILIVEAGELDRGLALLDLGFERNPDAWILPYLAGWECHRAGEYSRAAAYFARAAKAPGAPAFVLRLRAGMTAKAGDLREAIREWRDVLDDPKSGATAREIARRQVRDLTVRADVRDLESAVLTFRAAHGHLPRTLEEVARAGLVASIPDDPDGEPYVYDRATGRVSTPASRLLGGS